MLEVLRVAVIWEAQKEVMEVLVEGKDNLRAVEAPAMILEVGKAEEVLDMDPKVLQEAAVVEYLIRLEEAETLGVGVALESPLPLKEGMEEGMVEYLDQLKEAAVVEAVGELEEEAEAEDRLEEEEENPIMLGDDPEEEFWTASVLLLPVCHALIHLVG